MCVCIPVQSVRVLEADHGEEAEIVRAPAGLAGCLQGSEWNISIRKLSFSGVFVRV